MRLASLATAIPALMVAGPLVGWFAGHWLGGFVGHAKGVGAVGIALGIVAAARETVRIVRRILAETR